MKNIFLILVFLTEFLFAALWSSSGEDGINQAFEEYDNKVKQLNQKTIENYERISKSQVDKVVKNDELKKRLLINHRELLKSESIEKQRIDMTNAKLKMLIDNEATK
ncbi:TPA: hypothetical protein RPV63_001540 [Campylobacter fetus subsp. venerealis]|nr:hypothetical protein [Campylobacter fetus subsp. venerealis]HDX6253979.1 hypothetical protein [Campylobacter fetus subsp. venerealis]HDX6258167.1 hypothetical protein [Campylobacter fetus subsp. venerealis]HDX6261826.1 hypothetical protein [Campylobacter fetus subsp. venerealis]HDX6263956.1 hypothetical protein [Campylobacter fetus subsp. venerealis]